MVTGAFFGPYDGESSDGTTNLCSAKDKEKDNRKIINTTIFFMNTSP
jgi:hypothetical protein